MLRVQIKNYQIIEDLEFTVDGITVISGKSNNGKSAIFRAIQACCLGQLGKSFIRDGEKECTVKITFDKEFGWGRNKKEPYFLLEGADKPFTKTGGKPPEEFSQALNIKPIELEKVTIIPNFASQFDPLFVVGSGPTEAAALLSFLFSGEKFPELLKKVAKDIKDNKAEITFKEGSLEQLGTTLTELRAKHSRLKTYEPFFEYRKHISMWRQAFQILDKEISDLQESQRAVDDTAPLVAVNHNVSLVLSPVSEETVDYLEQLDKDYYDLLVATKAVGDGRYQAQVYRVESEALAQLDESVPAYLEQLSTDIQVLQELEDGMKQQVKLMSVTKTEEAALSTVDTSVITILESVEKDAVDLGSLVQIIEQKEKDVVRLREEVAEMSKQETELLSQITVCPTCSSHLTDETKNYLIQHAV